jgi:hypothetical protein
MSVILVAGAAVAIGGGIFKAIGGGRRAAKAKKEAAKAKKELAKQKKAFAAIDTSNPFANAKNAFAGLGNVFKDQKNVYENQKNVFKDMENKFEGKQNAYDTMKNSYEGIENAYEDLTVDTRQAEFEAKQNEATQANILSSMAGAAGGSGIAALAQSMANQGALNASKASASIGQQESANQKLAAAEEGKLAMAKAGEQGRIDTAKAAEQGRLDSQEAQGATGVQAAQLGEESKMQSRKLGEESEMQSRELGEASRLQTQEATGAMDVQKLKGEGKMWSTDKEMEKQSKLMDMTQAEITSAEGKAAQGRKDMHSGIGGIAKGIVGLSDIRTKENISKLSYSKSGIPVYKFNYKGQNETWTGTMAQDLISLGREDAVVKMDNGYYGVYYDMIDVDMKLFNDKKE